MDDVIPNTVAKTVCAQCGTIADVGLIFCAKCGAALRQLAALIATVDRHNSGVTLPTGATPMRIMSLRVSPVARIFAIVYGVCSPFLLIGMALSKADYLRIPLGIIAAPLFFVNINFDIQHPTHILSAALLVLFAAACYAATGWLTGAALVLCFNFIARRTGGIQASVLTKELAHIEPAL
jgi:hypothetical protein